MQQFRKNAFEQVGKAWLKVAARALANSRDAVLYAPWVCRFMIVHSSDVSLRGALRMASGVPILPVSCMGAASLRDKAFLLASAALGVKL